MYRYHSFLIHSFADGRLGGFHVLAVVNSAAMNIGAHKDTTLFFLFFNINVFIFVGG